MYSQNKRWKKLSEDDRASLGLGVHLLLEIQKQNIPDNHPNKTSIEMQIEKMIDVFAHVLDFYDANIDVFAK